MRTHLLFVLFSVYPLDRELQLSQMLSDRPDIPKIVIISVSIIGTFLLILNIVVVSYFIYKKRANNKAKQEEGTDFFIFLFCIPSDFFLNHKSAPNFWLVLTR